MDAEHKKQLAYLTKLYGSFEVLKALTDNINTECATTYADNDGAVIHRLRPIFNEALEQAKGTHVLYQVLDR